MLVTTLTVLAFVLRAVRYDSFPIYGDEWNSLYNAAHLGNSVSQALYAIQLAIVLNLFGLTEFTARLPAMLYGAASIPVIYLLARAMRGVHAGMIAAFLFAIAPFNIAQSQEVRYYSQFGFFALLAAYAYWRFLKEDNRTFGTLSVVASLLMVATTFNGIFPVAGMLLVLLFRRIQRSKQPGRNWVFVGGALIILALITLLMRAEIYLTIQRLADASQSLSDPGYIKGWGLSTLVKPFFVLLNFVVGPNISPIQFWWQIGLLILVSCTLFTIGLIKTTFPLNVQLSAAFLFIPALFQIGIAEPLSTFQYATIEPKHLMYAFPVWLAFVAVGASILLSKRVGVPIVIGVVIAYAVPLYAYYYPSYSYYAGRIADMRPALAELEPKVAGAADTLFIVDPAARDPFDFYTKGRFTPNKVISPYDADLVRLKSYTKIFLVLLNWKTCVPQQKENDSIVTTFDSLYARLDKDFQVSKGYVRYPLFVLEFGPKNMTPSDFLAAPFSCYGFQYSNLSLPFPVKGHLISSSFLVQSNTSIQIELPQRDTPIETLDLLFNLENTLGLKEGTRVGEIRLHLKSGYVIEQDLRYSVNAADAFANYFGNPPTNDSVQVVTSWQHQPLMTTSLTFPGANAGFTSQIYSIPISTSATDPPKKIEISYDGEYGGLRFWGIILNDK